MTSVFTGLPSCRPVFRTGAGRVGNAAGSAAPGRRPAGCGVGAVCRFGENGGRECPPPAGPFAALPPQVDLPALEQDDPAAVGGRQGLRPVDGGHGGPPAVGLLRGTPDRQRPAGHAPHRGAGVQGRLPPVQDHAGVARPAPGRLGLPRPARRDRRRAGARLRGQARHRALRHRRVQRPLPGVGGTARRLVLRAHPPHGLLGRHVHGLLDDGPRLHRERLVVAQAGLRQGPAGRGPPRRALLPAVRHRPVRPRGRPGLRDPDRPVGLRAAAGHQRRVGRQGRPADLDDDAVDAAVEHRRRHAPRRDLRGRPARATDTVVVAEPLLAAVLGEDDVEVLARTAGRDWERTTYQRPFELVEFPEPDADGALRRPGRLRDDRGRHRPGAPVPRLRRRRPRGLPRLRHAGGQPDRRAPGTSSPTSRWSAGTSSRPPTPRWSRT